jgi:type II secretory pathway pseudopilin PulG
MSAENKLKKVIITKSDFTLVEVLAVMGLMAILLFMALPAFEKIAKGNGVEIAARTLSGKLGMARGYAINNRQYVAVLMPIADLPDNYLYRSYKLCVVSSTYDKTSGSPSVPPPYTFKFIRWIPSENWGFLPTGAAINHISSSVHSGNANGTGTFLTPAVFPFEQVKEVKLSEINSAYASVDNVRAIVFRPNGKLAGAGDSRYVAVTESTYSGSTLATTNQKNWIDITIDQFTGRVTYGSE